jgi:hypothetical protein
LPRRGVRPGQGRRIPQEDEPAGGPGNDSSDVPISSDAPRATLRPLGLALAFALAACGAGADRGTEDPVPGLDDGGTTGGPDAAPAPRPRQDAGTAPPPAQPAPDAAAPVDAASGAPRDAAVAETPREIPGDARPTGPTSDGGSATRLPEIAYPEHIRKTMSLLAESTAEKPNEVRILAFGQSISDRNAKWWPMVRDRLRLQYPNARITMETGAHGGCAARCLLGEEPDFTGEKINYVETRALPFKAHLIIFHVYGNEGSYEQIVSQLRDSGAEVLLQSDHVTWRPADGSPYPQGTLEASRAKYESDVKRNTSWMYELAERRGCAVAPIWQEWTKYLDANKLKGRDLTRDGLHPNDRGYGVIADIIERALTAAKPR